MQQDHKNKQILLSPKDLVTFLGCHHASFLDIHNLNVKSPPSEDNSFLNLLRQKGLKHEQNYLDKLRADGQTIVTIPKNRTLSDRVELTLKAMHAGADIIYQATLLVATWRGDADLLVKCSTPSALGNHSYEVVDIKLKRTAEPKHIIQLCVYSDLLAQIQKLRPSQISLILGNDLQQHDYRVSDFFSYYTHAMQRFKAYLENLPAQSSPEPCSHCNICKWHNQCSTQWQAESHLSLVANITHTQINKLRKANINTLIALASTAQETAIPDLNIDVFLRLRSQAILQHHKATTGANKFELIAFPANKGFFRMSSPDAGDLFFDMEGDPLFDAKGDHLLVADAPHPKGLEYLFGVIYHHNSETIFKPFWAHNHEEEKASFQKFMQFIDAHLRRHTRAHIYHYNHYETTALKRLACRYASCEEQLDNLLRQQKFIDLYLVVRESVRISEPSYSIKNLEAFYMEKRDNTVTTAMDSIIVYNNWCQTGANALLDEIANYNEVDCISTAQLRDWLLKIKPADTTSFETSQEESLELQRKDWEIEYEDCQKRLLVGIDKSPHVKEHLAHLLEYHNREAKPQWWRSFERQNKFAEELIDDTECLGGLEMIGDPEPEKRSLIYTYKFPPQEYKLKAGNPAIDVKTLTSIGTIVRIDDNTSRAKIKCSVKKTPAPTLTIGPPLPIDSRLIRAAIYNYADELLNAPKRPHPATELLAVRPPSIANIQAGEALIKSDDSLYADALAAITGLNNSYLFIQGPPGAGKTHTSSHIIVDLIKLGKKVGITSNSHKAIHNLLKKLETVAAKQNVSFKGIKKSSRNNTETEYEGEFFDNVSKTQEMSLAANVFAGTAWTFAHPHFYGQLDYLFIDEAGQVSTANVVAMSSSSKNIILVGDQMQLGQPVQGTHPGSAGLSILEFLLGKNATIPADRGIFLNQTYRLRPSICKFISDTFYDSRLTAHKSASERNLNLQNTGLPNEGLVMIPAEHQGCSQKSIEEGAIIKDIYNKLLGQICSRPDAKTGIITQHAITEEDILVVTPYNVQVNYLRSLLPKARVGTVDKFQGQEALIVLISMVVSSAEYLARGIEFLYSKNRLNVALSRAQCLAVVVINPKLFEIPCKTLEHMKLVNTFCQLDEFTNQFSLQNALN